MFNVSCLFSGKLKPRSKRRVSSESPQKSKSSSDKKLDRRRRKSSVKPASEENLDNPDSLSEASVKSSEDSASKNLDSDLNTCDTDVKSPPSLPIRLPTKCKPKTDSDSDSDSKSTKSSASSASGKVSKVLKKTFKGKAIAIVKPFSNAVTEKKSPREEKQKEIEARLNLYDFGSDEDRGNSSRRTKLEAATDKSNSDKESSIESVTNLVTLSNSSSPSSISSIKGVKRIKSGKQGLLSARRLKSNPELRSVRVRVEKLTNSAKSDKSRNSKSKSSRHKTKEKNSNSGEEDSPVSQSEENSSSSLETVQSESEAAASASQSNCDLQGNESASVSECKEEPSAESLTSSNEDNKSVPTNHLHLAKTVKREASETPESCPVNTDHQSASSSGAVCKDEKIAEIVKSELFSQPSPSLNKDTAPVVKLKTEESDRNEDSNSLRIR